MTAWLYVGWCPCGFVCHSAYFGCCDRCEQAELAASNKKKFLVECSYFEVYNEILYDLLDPARKAGQASHGRGLDIKVRHSM